MVEHCSALVHDSFNDGAAAARVQLGGAVRWAALAPLAASDVVLFLPCH
ncbi:hypothetical protein [Streptomyces sp. NPDC005876]